MELAAAAPGLTDQLFDQLPMMLGDYSPLAVSVLKIIGINIVLSGDNAVVIALACRSLPPKQRMAGILLGAGAAILLRVLFTLVVQQLLNIQFLKLVGALLLFWIAVKLLVSDEASAESVSSGSNLWEAVKIVAIADMVMSLDNVLAIAAAAGGDANLIILGLLISIPLVVGGSTLIMALLTRYPIFVWFGAALLGWIAGELLATEPALAPAIAALADRLQLVPELITTIIETSGALLVVLAGWVIVRRSGLSTTEHVRPPHAETSDGG